MTFMQRWCNLCQSAPVDGTLTVEFENGEQFDLEACQDCFDKVDWTKQNNLSDFVRP